MNNSSILRRVREGRNINPVYAASFIFTNEEGGYWDLEGFDEVWTLTLSEFMRLCLLCSQAPSELLPPDAARFDGSRFRPSVDEYGNLQLALPLKQLCGDVSAAEEATGWEASSLSRWIGSESALSLMPLEALNDLCGFLRVSLSDVVTGYWQALGGRTAGHSGAVPDGER